MSLTFTGPSSTKYTVPMFEPDVHIAAIKMPIIMGTVKAKVALLQRGRNDELLITVSGWACTYPQDYQLDNVVWKEEVVELCKWVGHNLAEDWRDQMVLGRFNACHAEKQAVAYCWSTGYKGVATVHVSRQPCPDCTLFLPKCKKLKGWKVRVKVGGIAVA